jgi:hypothetical protein
MNMEGRISQLSLAAKRLMKSGAGVLAEQYAHPWKPGRAMSRPLHSRILSAWRQFS